MQNRRETSYYPEIMDFIQTQIVSNFKAKYKKELKVYCKIGELTSKLRELIIEYPDYCKCLEEFANTVPPLNLDIFVVITNGVKFEILILEIKLVKSVGLSEWSQLVGYCIVSGAKYGLLVNIDNGASSRMNNLLQNETEISSINRSTVNGIIEHKLGLMQWNSYTQNFEYSNLGAVWSISALCELLSEQFSSEI